MVPMVMASGCWLLIGDWGGDALHFVSDGIDCGCGCHDCIARLMVAVNMGRGSASFGGRTLSATEDTCM